MTGTITVLLVDDQRLMRDGLRTLLELEGGFAVVGEASDGEAALEAYAARPSDVVLMDIRMPGMGGVEATRRLIERWPTARVLILTTFSDDASVFDGLRAGALGYVLKDVSGQELAQAVRTIAGGGALLDPAVARRVMGAFARLAPPSGVAAAELIEPLSERERAVLRLLGGRADEWGDRTSAAPERRNGQELCDERLAEDRGPRPDTGGAAWARAGCDLGSAARSHSRVLRDFDSHRTACLPRSNATTTRRCSADRGTRRGAQ